MTTHAEAIATLRNYFDSLIPGDTAIDETDAGLLFERILDQIDELADAITDGRI